MPSRSRRTRLPGNALAALGQAAGFATGAERAAAIGYSRSHLMQVERGFVRPSPEMVDAMATAYHKTVEQIERAADVAREQLANRMLAQVRGLD